MTNMEKYFEGLGKLVPNWLTENEIEIRHIAVQPEYQGSSIRITLLIRKSE